VSHQRDGGAVHPRFPRKVVSLVPPSEPGHSAASPAIAEPRPCHLDGAVSRVRASNPPSIQYLNRAFDAGSARRPDVVGVAAHLGRSDWISSQSMGTAGRPLADLLMADTRRLMYSLKLHLAESREGMSFIDEELSRRVFWCAYTTDKSVHPNSKSTRTPSRSVASAQCFLEPSPAISLIRSNQNNQPRRLHLGVPRPGRPPALAHRGRRRIHVRRWTRLATARPHFIHGRRQCDPQDCADPIPGDGVPPSTHTGLWVGKGSAGQ
jgi:hypothetical protein